MHLQALDPFFDGFLVGQGEVTHFMLPLLGRTHPMCRIDPLEIKLEPRPHQAVPKKEIALVVCVCVCACFVVLLMFRRVLANDFPADSPL